MTELDNKNTQQPIREKEALAEEAMPGVRYALMDCCTQYACGRLERHKISNGRSKARAVYLKLEYTCIY